MDSIYDILNISNDSLESKIELAIKETKEYLNNITYERMCKVYSQYVFNYLRKNHVVSRIINTKDIGASYEHHFVLIPIDGKEYYLVDLTYKQFNNKDYYKELYDKGYEKISSLDFAMYYSIVTNDTTNKSLSDVFSKNIMRR